MDSICSTHKKGLVYFVISMVNISFLFLKIIFSIVFKVIPQKLRRTIKDNVEAIVYVFNKIILKNNGNYHQIGSFVDALSVYFKWKMLEKILEISFFLATPLSYFTLESFLGVNVRLSSSPTSTTMSILSPISPISIFSAIGSSIYFWIVRLNGRAPNCGS